MEMSLQRRLKDSTPSNQQRNIVYQVHCTQCEETYIVETSGTLGTTLEEHLGHARTGHPELSALADHAIMKDHRIDWENPKMLDYEKATVPRKIKEAARIHSQRIDHRMNKDKGLELSPIWTDLLKESASKRQ